MKSIKFFGFNNHKFDVICECDIEDRFNLELKYALEFGAYGHNGLNTNSPPTTSIDKENPKVRLTIMVANSVYLSLLSGANKLGISLSSHVKNILTYYAEEYQKTD